MSLSRSTAAPPATSIDVAGEEAPTIADLLAAVQALDAKVEQVLTAQTNVAMLILTVQGQLAPVSELAGRAKSRLDQWKARKA